MSSIYHPYFRGKQFELLTIRENVDLLLQSDFCPIIEPVNASLTGLIKATETLENRQVPYVLIVNPKCTAEAAAAPEAFLEIVNANSGGWSKGRIGILINESSTLDEFNQIASLAKAPIGIIHDGFLEGKTLANAARAFDIYANFFNGSKCGKLYRRNFTESTRILIQDGFKKRPKNSAYPPFEEFSDLHLLYEEEQMHGFGDYLIAGEEFSEGGGPAWAVAIHITIIDPDMDNKMMVHHFISDSNDTSTNPAGKFMEALEKLVEHVNDRESKISRTTAIKEFLDLRNNQHFPGLGYIKKLSMKHHLEVMSDFLGGR